METARVKWRMLAAVALCALLTACVSPSRVANTADARPPASLEALAGCWVAAGEVQGKRTENLVRGSWRLGGRYFMLEAHGVDPSDPYDAAIVMADAGDGALTAFWMDSFGGAFSVSGTGRVSGAEFIVTYAYPDSTYVNSFSRSELGWTWRVMEEKPNEAPSVFALYALSPSSCDGMPNVF